MKPLSRSFRAGAPAFTLLEVLVASAILGVVMMVLLNTLSTSLSLWRNTESKAAADREARGAELLLVEDLDGVILPAAPALWPTVSGSGPNRVLQFLTTKPADYMPTAVGDVFFVEYRVDTDTGTMRRTLLDSGQTFSNVLVAGRFPAAKSTASDQLLASNLLANNRDAARGLSPLQRTEANNTNFILLNSALLPITGTPGTNNIPVAIEVNFAVADPEVLRNPQLLANTNYILRNAGLYSTRFRLPPPMITLTP
jgi:prepilin-type N-terminal cleavage/methylation domain-containing protein